MIPFIRRLYKKILEKDWNAIVRDWIWIYRYVKKYRFQIVLYTVLGLTGTLTGLAGSVLSKRLIDAVTGYDAGSIGWIASFYVGLGIGRILINTVTGRISLLIQAKVRNEIQADIFDQIMYTNWEDMSDFTTGDLLVRITGDTSVISGSVLNFLPTAITTLVNFAGAFFIVCYHDPVMAFIALAGAPVTFLLSRYRLEKMKGFQKESQQMSSKRMSFNQETFQNVQSIKSFGVISEFSNRMRSIQQEALDLSIRQYHYQAWTNIIMSVTGLLVSYGCYGFAIYRLWQGDISFGTMTLFVSMAGSLSGSFSSVVNLVPLAIRAATSAERIMDVTGLPTEEYRDYDKALEIREQAGNEGIYVQMDRVDFTYKDGRNVYEQASLHADPGEIIALIGPSGQGKTTTLRLLLGLLTPRKGKIRAGNPNGDSLEISPSTRCFFSYVPQRNALFHGTIAENLRLVKPEATEEEIREVLEAACAWKFVSRLEKGVDTMIGERGHGFSEGQNQRISIARALLSNAPVLLLDEATSALDVATERKVLKKIMKKDPKRTIIVTAHRPSVFSMCSRIYKIEEGRVKEVNEQEIQSFMEEF